MRKIFNNNKLITLGMIFCMATGMFAAEKKDSKIQPRFALIIGNQNYEINPLDSTIKDAQLMKATLEDCCFDVSYYIDLDKDGMDKAINDYSEKVNAAGEDAVSLFYYAGHGVQIEGKNYLVPTNDKDIDTELKAKLRCFKVDNLFEYVNAKTHIFILDACRNNPFKNNKQNYTRGLSTIQAPQGTNFLYLFATQAGETAADGEAGKNSLFTSVLASEMKKTNVSINTVFSDVSQLVTEKSNQKQRPLYTGTSINFELMNESVANWKLAQLKATLEELKAAEKKETDAETKKSYSSRQALLNAQIKDVQERREKSIKDAEEKAKEERERKEREKEVQKEAEKTKKEAEKARRQAQENRAREQSSYNFIAEMENSKKEVQQLRSESLEKITKANEEIDEEVEKRISEVKNKEHTITELDANGKLTKTAQKKEDDAIAKIKEEGEKQKQKAFETYHEPIKEEEKDIIQQIEKDKNTLKNKTYEASSFIDELTYEVLKLYDGEKKLWTIRVNSKLFGDSSLINENIEVPYNKLEKKDPEKDGEYDQKVTLYNKLLRDKDNTPFEVRVKYTIKAVDGKTSTYLFTAKSLSVYYSDGEEKELNTKKIIASREITWPEITEVIDLKVMLENYNKLVEEEKRKELQRQKAEQKRNEEAARKEEQARKELAREENIKAKKNMYNSWSVGQIPVDGLKLGMGYVNESFMMEGGWAFPIGRNFYAGPALVIGSGKDLTTDERNGIVGIAGFAGINYSFDITIFHALRPYFEMTVRFDTLTKAAFNTLIGLDYIYNEEFSIGANLGFDVSKTNKTGFTFNVGSVIPLDTMKGWF